MDTLALFIKIIRLHTYKAEIKFLGYIMFFLAL